MGAYELDTSAESYSLASLADTLKELSQSLQSRTLGRVDASGQLRILGEARLDPETNTLSVTPTEQGVRHWGRLLPGGRAGEPVALGGAPEAVAMLIGSESAADPADPFAVLDEADPDSSIWGARTASELRVRHYDRSWIGPEFIISAGALPKALRQKGSPTHQQAVHRAFEVLRADPDYLVPVITKTAPEGASREQRQLIEQELVYEYAALEALRRQGISVAKASLRRAKDGALALIIERFDREPVRIREVSPSGAVSVNNRSLARGPQLVGVNDMARRLGQKTPEDPFHFIQSLCAKKPGVRDDWMTRQLFDALIGNVDHHPDNAGILWRDGPQQTSAKIAPSFDVTPHLKGDPGAIAQSPFKGRALEEVTLTDIARSHPGIRQQLSRLPDQGEASFSRARAAQNEMLQIVEGELLRKGLSRQADGLELRGYLSRPLGAETASPEPAETLSERATTPSH